MTFGIKMKNPQCRSVKLTLAVGAMLGAACICGCRSIAFSRLMLGPESLRVPGHQSVPVNPAWTVGPKSKGTNAAAMTFPETRLYASRRTDSRDTLHDYAIFWPSGHLLRVRIGSPTNRPPSYNDWNAGNVGYYEFDEHSRVISMEEYDYNPGTLRFVYRRSFSLMVDDDTITPQVPRRHLLGRNAPFYLKRERVRRMLDASGEMHDLSLSPDW